MAKKGYMLFKLLSSANTGYYYIGKKSTKKVAEKVNCFKHDPVINRHVLFVETKLKKYC